MHAFGDRLLRVLMPLVMFSAGGAGEADPKARPVKPVAHRGACAPIARSPRTRSASPKPAACGTRAASPCFPRMLRIRDDKPLHEADTLATLEALLEAG